MTNHKFEIINLKSPYGASRSKEIINLKYIILCIILVLCAPIHAQIGMKELGDSLTVWTGFSPAWSSSVKVKSMRVNKNKVTVRTNTILKDVRWTPALVTEAKRKVSFWVLGHEKGKITIQAGKTNIDDLVTDCAKGIMVNGKQHDLTEHNIALYPSHGLYFNRDRQEWIWQRATLWTTVEDLYSQEYVRLIRQMLENAGATIYTPRADLSQHALGVSGMPQWTEGARYWLMSQNADTTLWDLYEGDEYKDDMKCRAMWVNSLKVPIDLCLAFHTDGQDSGNDSTIIGTLVIYTAKNDSGLTVLRNGKDRERVNRNLADIIQTQVTNDLRTLAPEWTRRQLKEANYCESRVPDVPSLILELLSHKNMADMRYGLDPNFRFAASRAVYKGILRYINGKSAIVQPLPIRDLGVQFTNDQSALLRWIPVTDSLEPTATPTYYMVYTQANDGEWDVQQVTDTQVLLPLQPGILYNYYVVAGNDGGLSFPSPIISAYQSNSPQDGLTGEAGLTAKRSNSEAVLIVDAFHDVYGPEWFADSLHAGIVPGTYACEDGFSCAYIGQQWNYDRADEWKDDDNCGWGACYRDHAGFFTIGNTRDYAAQHGRELWKMKISYTSCTEGYLINDKLQITNYKLLDIVCGRNRVPLKTESYSLITEYLSNGGRLLLSTDHFSAIDPVWADTCLHARFYAARATRSGRITSPRHRIYQLQLEPNEEQLFTPAPEGIMPTDTLAIRMASYEDMRCPAAIGYQSPITNHQSQMTSTLVYSFPLEAVQSFDKIYRHAIEWLLRKEE